MEKEYKGMPCKKEICPVCHREELSYHHFHLDDDCTQIAFPWECRGCGATGEEAYTLDFIGHDKIKERR